MRSPPLRTLDTLWGLSLLTWAALRIRSGIDPLPVRASVFALHILIAALFFLRRPAYATLSMRCAAAVLPSFAVGLVAVATAPLPATWPLPVQVLFGAGAGLTIVSFAYLGRAFGVLPAHRGVVARGPYVCVRHPGYLGESIMIAAVCTALGGVEGVLLGVATAVAFALRIGFEESVLADTLRYRAYRRRVRHRLLPGLW